MKNALLTSAAVVAIAVAGVSTASASTLSYRTSAAAGDIDAGVTGAALSPYFIAAESNSILTALTNVNDLALNLDLTGPATLPSTGVTLTVTLTGNAAWATGGVTPADITGAGTCSSFTVVPVSGGAAGSKTATFLISNSAADCQGVNLDLPVSLTSAAIGDVVVSTELSVSGTPIDPPQGTLTALRVANAFSATITPDTAVVSPYPTNTVIAGPAFTTFLATAGYNAILGTATVARQANSYRNLTIANTTADADIVDLDVAVTGAAANIFNTVDLTQVAALSGTATTITPVSGTVESALNGTGVGSVTLGLATAAAGAIPPSTFSGTLTTTLGTGYTVASSPTFTGPLQQIVRQGVTVLVPWLSSATRGGAGTNNNIRISNNGGAPAAVFAEVINTRFAGAGYTNPGLVQIGTIAAGTSDNWNSTRLEGLLGDYGQADIRITVAGAANQITMKRVQQTADGGITEVSLGTATADVANSN